jgi:hypothetical protein
MGRLLAVLSLVLPFAPAHSRCVPYLPVLAEVQIEHCETLPDAGFLARGKVISAALVESRRHPGGVRPHRPPLTLGEHSLLVLGAPAPECPTAVPVTAWVLARPRCGEEARPVPGHLSGLVRVTLEPAPSNWVPVGPSADG